MPRLDRWALSGLLLLSPGAYAQSADTITVRAIWKNVNTDLVQYVARKARPFELKRRDIGPKGLAAKDIVARLCGSLRQDYWTELVDANKGKKIEPDQVITDPGAYSWPRCFYVEVYEPPRVVPLGPKETGRALYRRYTGGAGSPEALKEFFGAQPTSKDAEGRTVKASYRTVPVTIAPRDNNLAEFHKELESIAKKVGAGGIEISDTPVGIIVTAVPSWEEDECKAVGVEPFKANAVKLAYDFTYGVIKANPKVDEPRRAKVLVVDNGFFGTNPENDDRPFDGSPFPSGFFRGGGQSKIAERISVARTVDYIGENEVERTYIDPINHVHGLIADETSGHGTHVTGLVLGGPAFLNVRGSLRDRPWAEITVLNIGKGDRWLIEGAHEQVLRAVSLADESTGYIVNLSIGYHATAKGVRAVFDAVRRKIGTRGLLVAAAGNNNDILSTRGSLPGVLGGPAAENLLTVAAHDADSRVAPFSNHDQSVVDIAAPGCGVASWIDHNPQPTALSGTSMATPLVTFSAALLRSLVEDAPGADIKTRLVVAADLLPKDESGKTAYRGIQLNIPKALYWFHDYVRTAKGEQLGNIQRLSEDSLRCRSESGAPETPRVAAEIWSIKKRADRPAVMFLGKRNFRVDLVCELADVGAGEIVFSATHEIVPESKTPEGIAPARIRPLDKPEERRIPIRDVLDLVYRAPARPN